MPETRAERLAPSSSKYCAYTWDAQRPRGDFVPADSMMLNGKVIDPAREYRVVVNSFLADGGDGFSVFQEATDPRGGPPEIKALEAYFAANSPLAPDTTERIRRSADR